MRDPCGRLRRSALRPQSARKRSVSFCCLLKRCPVERCAISSRLPQRLERSTELGAEELRLLPCGEVAALIDLVEINEVAIGAPRPGLRGSIDVLRKHRDRHGE